MVRMMIGEGGGDDHLRAHEANQAHDLLAVFLAIFEVPVRQAEVDTAAEAQRSGRSLGFGGALLRAAPGGQLSAAEVDHAGA